MSILMTGTAYCPLSPRDPRQRLQALMKETHGRLVLVHSMTRDKFPYDCRASLCNIDLRIDTHSSSISIDESDLVRLASIKVTPVDIAYVIFTSGSTGTPKAVSFFFCILTIVRNFSTALLISTFVGASTTSKFY